MQARPLDAAKYRPSFRADQSGVSAVEFALLLPVLILLLFGSIEVTQAVTTKRKVTLVASSVADLVSRVDKVNDAEMTNIFDAGKAIITPYDANILRTVVSSVVIDPNGAASVAWSKARNGSPRSQPPTLPKDLVVPNTSLVVSEVSYSYTPVLGYVITGSLNLAETFYLRPRVSAKVDWVQ